MKSINNIKLQNIKLINKKNTRYYKGVLCIENKPAANFEYDKENGTSAIVFNCNVLTLGDCIEYCLAEEKNINRYLRATQQDQKNEDYFFNVVQEYYEENNIKSDELNEFYDALLDLYFKEK